MSRSAWVDPRIDEVTVEGAKAYLLGHGWRPRPFPRPELLVFEGPVSDEGRPIVQILPSCEGLVDYRMRMEELIGALGVIENRPPVAVLAEMLNPSPTNGAVKPSAPEQIEAR